MEEAAPGLKSCLHLGPATRGGNVGGVKNGDSLAGERPAGKRFAVSPDAFPEMLKLRRIAVRPILIRGGRAPTLLAPDLFHVEFCHSGRAALDSKTAGPYATLTCSDRPPGKFLPVLL